MNEEDRVEMVAKAIASCEWDQACTALGTPNLPRGGNWTAKLPQARAAITALQGVSTTVTEARPQGGAGDAIDFAADHCEPEEAIAFLNDWRSDLADERWPGYMKWLNFQRKCAAESKAERAAAPTAPVQDDDAGHMAVLIEALHPFEKAESECPFSGSRSPPSDRPCPKCAATSNEGCRPQTVAAYAVVNGLRAGLAARGDLSPDSASSRG